MTAPSPRPWRLRRDSRKARATTRTLVDRYGHPVAHLVDSDRAEENARIILACVNTHRRATARGNAD